MFVVHVCVGSSRREEFKRSLYFIAILGYMRLDRERRVGAGYVT